MNMKQFIIIGVYVLMTSFLLGVTVGRIIFP